MRQHTRNRVNRCITDRQTWAIIDSDHISTVITW